MWNFFRRRIDQRTVARCVITVVVSCAWIGCFTVLICALEPSMSSLDIFFENCSAFCYGRRVAGHYSRFKRPFQIPSYRQHARRPRGAFRFSHCAGRHPYSETLPLSIRQNPVNLNIP